jgi:pimeloyl-ACP methyl ester carboxylesterase
MPPPLVGMGQSWGGYAIVPLESYLAGGAGQATKYSTSATKRMAKRRDKWKSIEEARQLFAKNPYFAAFDKEVFERVMKHDFRTLPDGSVELTTPKAQEVATMVRLNPSPESEGHDFESRKDFDGSAEQYAIPGFYRPEPAAIMKRLREITPPVLFLWGSESAHFLVEYRAFLEKNTGIGIGANGGMKNGGVTSVVVKGSNHPMPLEQPQATAEAMVPWIRIQIEKWNKEMDVSLKGKFYTKEVNPLWLKEMSKI